jgi:hypothetical protein
VFAGSAAVLVAALQPNLALALVAALRRYAAWAATGIALAAFAAITLVAGGGAGGFATYLHRLASHGDAERFIAIQYTPAAIARAFGSAPGVASAIGTAIAVAAIAATAYATVRARLAPRDGALLGIAALPLAVPFFHEHDFVLALIPLIVLAVSATGTARALAGVATALIGVDWFGLAQRPLATGQILALGIVAALAFTAVAPARRASAADAAPFAALLAVACVAVPLAHANPAPTWPDALPPAYRAPERADAAAVWDDEQRAAGLAAVVPAWGALRAIPLAGCIVLGVAILRAARRDGGREANAA